MRIAISADLAINTDTMYQYVTSSTTLKTMMRMLSDELDIGAKSIYLDATEARVHFQKYVTIEYIGTIADYQSCHQFATIDHHDDVKELVFP